MRLSSPRLLRHLALAAATTAAVAGCASSSTGGTAGADVDADSGGEASCAAVIVHDGATYAGQGRVLRDPATTGREVAAVLPGCDDSGGQDEAEEDQQVQVAELEGVPLETAFLWQESIFVREGHELPQAAEAWFEVPRCTSETEFEILADWLGVTTPKKPRFDGDLRPPYRLEVHVVEGPDEYVGATVELHADGATDPALGPEDVKSSLWEGGTVRARVSCEEEYFRALSLQVPPQR